jgi:hypothetical protein
MTAAGSAKRKARGGEFYTPVSVALALLRRLDLFDGAIVLEPSCGAGGWLEALILLQQERGITLRIYACDVSRYAPALCIDSPHYVSACFDFTDAASWPADWPRPDFIVGNPPYSITETQIDEQTGEPLVKGGGEVQTKQIEVATDHTVRALEICDRVLYLFPLMFRGSQRRFDRLWSHGWLDREAQLCPRVSFTGGSTDATEYAGFYFDKRRDPSLSWSSEFVRYEEDPLAP